VPKPPRASRMWSILIYGLGASRSAITRLENRWQHELRPGLMSKDAEGQALQVGFSTTILSLEENRGSDYNR